MTSLRYRTALLVALSIGACTKESPCLKEDDYTFTPDRSILEVEVQKSYRITWKITARKELNLYDDVSSFSKTLRFLNANRSDYRYGNFIGEQNGRIVHSSGGISYIIPMDVIVSDERTYLQFPSVRVPIADEGVVIRSSFLQSAVCSDTYAESDDILVRVRR